MALSWINPRNWMPGESIIWSKLNQISNDLSYLHGDGGTIELDAGLEWDANSDGVADTSLLPSLNSVSLASPSGSETGLEITATSGGYLLADGGLMSGAPADNVFGSGQTLTPDIASGNWFSATINVSGASTLTIANPINRAPSHRSFYLTVRVHNTGASGGTTLTWGTAYAAATSNALPSSVNFGHYAWCFFVWDAAGGFLVPLSVTTQ
jgi:hypothetical protein